jgi:hypothetical protein
MMDIRTLSKAQQESMLKNGWLRRSVRNGEDPWKIVERYEALGYKAKAYRTTTYVKGFYRYVVMTKR